MKHTIFLFGEAERGSFCTPLLFKSLEELVDHLGNPPHTSMGIPYAVQALMYQRELIFFRVEEEGYSYNDYKKGIELLKELKEVHPLSAICMPGVADESLIEAASLVCMKNKSMLIVDGSDLYDYLTLR